MQQYIYSPLSQSLGTTKPLAVRLWTLTLPYALFPCQSNPYCPELATGLTKLHDCMTACSCTCMVAFICGRQFTPAGDNLLRSSIPGRTVYSMTVYLCLGTSYMCSQLCIPDNQPLNYVFLLGLCLCITVMCNCCPSF